jgi:hypothetical protein
LLPFPISPVRAENAKKRILGVTCSDAFAGVLKRPSRESTPPREGKLILV